MALEPSPKRTAKFMRLKRPQREELADLEQLLASGLVERWGLAIDGGAHIGGWAVALAARFERVLAFEPAPDTFGLLAENVAHLPHVEARQEALMDIDGRVQMIAPRDRRALTARYALADAAGNAPGIAIDSLGLRACDFIKLDLEGAEALAIAGARATLRAFSPFIVIEEFGFGHRYGLRKGEAARALGEMGYQKVWSAGPNHGFRSAR